MPALRDARAADGGCTHELLDILIFFSLCFRPGWRSDGEMGAQCLGKAAPPQGPLKRCLKSFPASPAQQGSAKLRVLIVCPQNAATSGGGDVGWPLGRGRTSRPALPRVLVTATEPHKAAFGIWVPNSC